MLWQGIEIVCPRCRGDLRGNAPAGGAAEDEEVLSCSGCGATYPVILGIPDLRIFDDPYIDMESDRAKGRRLAARFADFDFPGFIDFYYSITDVVPPRDAARFTRGLLGAADRAALSLRAWEEIRPAGRTDLALLDLGCGTAPLLASAGPRYATRVGVDIAFRWLVVAKKRLEQAGVSAPLICACAEALPFPAGSFDRVVADSVLEHLTDQSAALNESFRVLRPNGAMFVTTPNRYSVGPDPHLGVWGGSWLPDSASAWVARRKGAIPPHRRLLSRGMLSRLFEEAGFVDQQVFSPDVAPGQVARFPAPLRLAIQTYRLARQLPATGAVLGAIGPLLSAVASKPATAPRPEPAHAA